MKSLTIFWFRHDLRLYDNHALHEALLSGQEVLPIYIFDKSILKQLENRSDPRITFIYRTLEELQRQLMAMGSTLLVLHSDMREAVEYLTSHYNITSIYANTEYDPDAVKRDRQIDHFLRNKGIQFKLFKDQVIFEKDELSKPDGSPFLIFNAYARAWRRKLMQNQTINYPCENFFPSLLRTPPILIPSFQSLGVIESNIVVTRPVINPNIIEHYQDTCDYPWMNGTTHLSVHLRFGTVSVRQLVHLGLLLNQKWLDELIWREYYIMLLYYQPHLLTECYKPTYESMDWRDNETQFKQWCEGKTGFPFIDAGMRQLLATGFMPGRVRIVAASFLCKYLLVDWRWGEHYFAQKLLDYNPAGNSGNWQWLAGCGPDAVPYYKFYNPEDAARRYDSQNLYQHQWLDVNYSTETSPIIDLKIAKKEAIQAFRKINVVQADDMD